MKDKIRQDEIISKLIQTIKSNNGIISLNEAIATLGYSKEEVVTAFNRLLELFESKADLNPNTGGLQFFFRYPLWLRGKKTFTETLASGIRFFLKIFKQVYKASVGVVMIAYTIIFVVILLLLSLSSSNSDDNRSNFSFDIVFVAIRAIMEAFYWRSITRPTVYEHDSHGNIFKTYESPKKGANFIKSVFTFVFGPEIPSYDPLSDAREIVAYIRLKTNGKLTSGNIIELSGASYNQADLKLTEYCGKFHGSLNVTNDGLLYGEFENLLGNISSKEEKFIEYYKDEIEPPVELTGNTTGRNLSIVLMNGFNLAVSSLMIYMFHSGEDISFVTNSNSMEPVTIPFVEYFFVAFFPFSVSLLYFIIPLLRIPGYLSRKSKRKMRVLHKILIGYICEMQKKEFTIAEFVWITKNKLDDINETDIQNILNQILTELQGTTEIKEDGQMVYIFERLYDELAFNKAV